MKKYNFCAGPCTLPQEVFEKTAQAVLDFNGSGLSILEISHRSKDFKEITERAQSLVLKLMNLSAKDYSVLLLQGGATLQFSMIPLNFLKKKAGYLNTGIWSNQSIDEARLLNRGEIAVLASSKEDQFRYYPKQFDIPEDLDYLQYTSNNTVHGTQLLEAPKTKVPLVCDMSSDIFSMRRDYSMFDLIYGGAQKNSGTSGATLVVIKNNFLQKADDRFLPEMLSYKAHVKAESIYNTPAVLPFYVSMLTLEWIDKVGIETIEKNNLKKSSLLYEEVDRNPLFEGITEKADRSRVNVIFRLKDERHDSLFKKLCEERNVVNFGGYRTIGGYRASLYNALPIEGVEAMVNAMKEVEKQA